jgi:hypothetical protein
VREQRYGKIKQFAQFLQQVGWSVLHVPWSYTLIHSPKGYMVEQISWGEIILRVECPSDNSSVKVMPIGLWDNYPLAHLIIAILFVAPFAACYSVACPRTIRFSSPWQPCKTVILVPLFRWRIWFFLLSHMIKKLQTRNSKPGLFCFILKSID